MTKNETNDVIKDEAYYIKDGKDYIWHSLYEQKMTEETMLNQKNSIKQNIEGIKIDIEEKEGKKEALLAAFEKRLDSDNKKLKDYYKNFEKHIREEITNIRETSAQKKLEFKAELESYEELKKIHLAEFKARFEKELDEIKDNLKTNEELYDRLVIIKE